MEDHEIVESTGDFEMKTYIFERGRIEAENLNGVLIKHYESTMGELLGVKIKNKGYVPTLRKGDPADELWKLRGSDNGCG